jgi:hypothetical protein
MTKEKSIRSPCSTEYEERDRKRAAGGLGLPNVPRPDAGMILSTARKFSVLTVVPRLCGDDPSFNASPVLSSARSPHGRGVFRRVSIEVETHRVPAPPPHGG